MKLRGFDITNSQRGWVCDCFFTVFTSNQFTAEEHVVRGRSKWLLFSMWNSYRSAKLRSEELKAGPGERELKGWG